MALAHRVQLLVAYNNDQLIIITAPDNAGIGSTDVFIAPVPLRTAIIKQIGSFGSLTPLAHVRACVGAASSQASPSSLSHVGNRMLFVQFFDSHSVNTRPFIGIMDLANGVVTRRNLPKDADLDSLWYFEAT